MNDGKGISKFLLHRFRLLDTKQMHARCRRATVAVYASTQSKAHSVISSWALTKVHWRVLIASINHLYVCDR